MEPKNYPTDKENHLRNLHFWVQNADFPGCIPAQKIPIFTRSKPGHYTRHSGYPRAPQVFELPTADIFFGRHPTESGQQKFSQWLIVGFGWSFGILRG